MQQDQVRELSYKELQAQYQELTGGNPVGKKKDELVEAVLEALSAQRSDEAISEAAVDAAEEGETLSEVLAHEAAPEPEAAPVDDARSERRQAQRALFAQMAQQAREEAQNAPELSDEARAAGFKRYNPESFKGVGGRYAKSGRCSIPNCRTGTDAEGRPSKGRAVYMKYPKAYCWEHALQALRRAGVKRAFADDEHNRAQGFAVRATEAN